MKKRLCTMLFGAAPMLAVAANDNLPEVYFSKNPNLAPQEKAAVAIAQKHAAATAGMKPVAGPEGSVRFIYGTQQITVVCAVLQACDVELQPGEQVNNINIGDPRFLVEPAVSGGAGNEVQHLIIKPSDVGLQTSLVVTTNRRTYRVRLRSHRTEFMPHVSFIYTEDAVAKWDVVKTREGKERQQNTMPKTGEYLGNLSFAYEISGSAAWKPVRVYNDGSKTIIQMPSTIAQTEAPTLLVVRKDGSPFTDADTVMVNYRVQGDRYIVDTVFDKAILIAGVGSSQDRVTIVKGK